MAITNLNIKTTKPVVPIIYCFTTPEITRHDGWSKIGYSEQDANTRIDQETLTADVHYQLEWTKNAVFEGSNKTFSDHAFHAYLTRCGVERMKPQSGHKKAPEWFHIAPVPAKHMLEDFRENHGIVQSKIGVIPYVLRKEQQEAENKAKDYFLSHEKGEFLFNCKPRFGKTLTVYDLCKNMKLEKVLIVTNRPAIANSWREDYCKFIGHESGYLFVSEVKGISDKPGVLSRTQYVEKIAKQPSLKLIEFVSLQDMKGSVFFGGTYNKLEEVKNTKWDMLVIDEAHEAVDTIKTDIAFDNIERKYTLHLSGTPFKALANDKFEPDAIYNWTYADEQKAKRDWNSFADDNNPYQNLPKLNMFTYQMSDIIQDELKESINHNDDSDAYAFDLNEFFAVNSKGFFIHDHAVDKFLDALTEQKKYPFSTDELRNELKHTFWLLNRVDSAKALARKLNKHPVFQSYKIILAAGDGKLDDTDATQKSFDAVKNAIANYDKTITLSVGQLTTGVTIPEWSGVLMLSNMKSPSLYMQAAFRAQNPCLYDSNGTYRRKQNAYLFDFDPARTLVIYDEFANDLCGNNSKLMDSAKHEKNIKELLNFFPVIGEDQNGEMVELNAEQILSIPRKIKSKEVVNRGFMSDFLFQNITHLFNAPQEVINVVNSFAVADLHKSNTDDLQIDTDLNLNEDGEVQIPKKYTIGLADKLFGKKIYQDGIDSMKEPLDRMVYDKEAEQTGKLLDAIKESFHKDICTPMIQTVAKVYGTDFSPKMQKNLMHKLKATANNDINSEFKSYTVQKKSLDAEKSILAKEASNEEEFDSVNKEYEQMHIKLYEEFKDNLDKIIDDLIKNTGETIIETVEHNKKEKKKQDVIVEIKDHLRGFARTIPSFLMAYGTDRITLQNFDTNIPDDVFKDVTSITLEQFRFLRDGGDVFNEATGKMEHFEGGLFDSVVFDDSVKEFLKLRKDLSNYFDPNNKKDIFDYIPPQKTNQIFTPRSVVVKMLDYLEAENPGCFDDPNKTFIDPYIKSGMYITEIAKRLFHSPVLKEKYPNDHDRLVHIFEHQLYSCAPTEIIYNIAVNYIFGFDEKAKDSIHHNIKCFDTMPAAQNGNLNQQLKELFER